jgi:hypothetical protein
MSRVYPTPWAGMRALVPESDPHHRLNQPATDPDPTEWPDPYDKRPDPRDPPAQGDEPPHTPAGATSTSEPHPHEDPEAIDADAPERDRFDRERQRRRR